MNNGKSVTRFETEEAPDLKQGCKHCGLKCSLLGFEELCPHYVKRAQGNLSNECMLKRRIYNLLSIIFEAPELSHSVAADFSEAELDNFIGTYLDYLSK